ncbi:hypothetical protein AB0N38_18745 [Micromonospora aurantiaca]|uniref:hypothetical protein n=1 Tax=Micromonospora aurantiaca (nom. illeg.) TaxID=47850 RepID=UPI001967E7BC|nr:hypothetical protein [Micromonospora aurantiaca]
MTSDQKRQDSVPLSRPATTDPNWRAKIRKAAEAREAGRKQREGKVGSFRPAVGRMAS